MEIETQAMVEGNNDKLTAPTLALAETLPGNLEEEGYEGDPRCQKCDTVVSADDIVVKHVTKGVQKKVLCKSCHAVQTMMARSFEEMPAGWDDLSHEDSVEFYKTMLQKKAEGPLRFQVLRAEMKAVLINRTLQETKKGFNGEFQPLSFWSQRGYDTQRIQEKAEKMDHDVLGPTYRVDIFHVSSETIKQRVEEALLKVDKTVKRKRIPKAKANNKRRKKGENKENEPIENIEPVDPDLMDLVDLESDDSCVVSRIISAQHIFIFSSIPFHLNQTNYVVLPGGPQRED